MQPYVFAVCVCACVTGSFTVSSVAGAGTDPASAKLQQRKRPAGSFPTADDGRLIVDDDRAEGSEAGTDGSKTAPVV